MISALRRKLRQSKYIRDIFWQGTGNSIAQVFSILGMPILTRLYTPENFGTLNLFLQIVSSLTIFLTWRYEYFIILPKKKLRAMALFRFLILLGVIGTILLTLLGYIYGDRLANLLNNGALASWIILAPLTALLTSVSIALQQCIQRQQDYRNSAFSEVINKTSYISIGLLGSFWLPNIIGLMLATGIGMLSKVLWLFRSIRTPHIILSNSGLAFLWKVACQYKRLSSSMVLSQTMLAITGGLPCFFIAKMYGGETLGQFSLVISTLYLPSSLIGNAIGQVYNERAAKHYAKGELFNRLWCSTAMSLVGIGLPIFTSIILLAPWAYPFFFGSRWEPAGQYAVLLAISSLMSFLTSPMDRGCLIVNAWWYLVLIHSARMITTIFIVWLAWSYQWPFAKFLRYLVVQMVAMYLIEWWSGWKFSNTNPTLRRLA